MVSVVVFEFYARLLRLSLVLCVVSPLGGVMRCQPLRRALAINLYFGIVGIKIKT